MSGLNDELGEMGATWAIRSETWFPSVHESRERLLMHLAMGVAEEGGEVLGVVKKWARNPLDFDTLDRAKLHGEMCDALIYLTILGDLTEIDWDVSLFDTITKCLSRWGRTPIEEAHYCSFPDACCQICYRHAADHRGCIFEATS